MDFLDYMFVSNPHYQRYRKLRKLLFIRALNKISLRMLHVDPIRAYGISFLRGYTKQELQEHAEKFYYDYLTPHKINESWAIIDTYRKPKYSLVIVSATLDCVANVIAEKLGVDKCYSSTLEYDNSTCKGKLDNDLLLSKLQYLYKQGMRPPYAMTISDNYSDLNLLVNSKEAYSICSKGGEHKWAALLKKESKDCNYIIISY